MNTQTTQITATDGTVIVVDRKSAADRSIAALVRTFVPRSRHGFLKAWKLGLIPAPFLVAGRIFWLTPGGMKPEASACAVETAAAAAAVLADQDQWLDFWAPGWVERPTYMALLSDPWDRRTLNANFLNRRPSAVLIFSPLTCA